MARARLQAEAAMRRKQRQQRLLLQQQEDIAAAETRCGVVDDDGLWC
jgi:hypothetical protein